MNNVSAAGRPLYLFAATCYAIAITAVGALHFVFGHTLGGLLPLPAWLPGHPFWTYLDGAVLTGCGFCLLFRLKPGWTSWVTAGWCVVLYLLIFFRGELLTPKDPAVWTGAAEILALGGGAFIWAGRRRAGEWLLAVALIVVAIQHFQYAAFIVGLIPAWIPFPLFWAYFAGVAFLGATVSILFRIQTRLVCSLLGLMFFCWVMILHIPRVMTAVHTETEWTSLFVALGMCGIAWMLASDSKT